MMAVSTPLGQDVLLLERLAIDDREEDWKIIGIYDADQAAMQAAEKARALPGFRDHPTSFHIDKFLSMKIIGHRALLLHRCWAGDEA